MKMVITNANRLEIVLGRPILWGIQAKETILVFYSTLSPQKFKKTKYRKTRRGRPPGVKCDPREGKSKFSKNGYHQQQNTIMLT
jgi:hypothetical protein